MKSKVFIAIFFLSQSIASADQAFDELLSAKSLKCEFGPGISADWVKGHPKIKNDAFNTTTHFDSIDLKKRTARLIGNQGAADLVVFTTGAGLTFFETTGSGNVVFTTVFGSQGNGKYIAVMSRHMDIIGKPMPSQYYGTCQIWE